MSAESATPGVQVSVGKDFVIMGGDRVEVSADGKRVTAYTNDGVEIKAASRADDVREISISADFNTVVLNGATIKRAADGHLVISAPGIVITKPAPANDSLFVSPIASSDVSRLLRANATPQIGDKMPAGHPQAGWIYAGISKTTHEPFYVAPKDSGVFQWKEAWAFAAKEDWRLPSKDELDQIYDAKDKGALKGTFNLTGANAAGWYWSSSQINNYVAWAQRFSDGNQRNGNKGNDASLRCVR
jgi:hypothetical protein